MDDLALLELLLTKELTEDVTDFLMETVQDCNLNFELI